MGGFLVTTTFSVRSFGDNDDCGGFGDISWFVRRGVDKVCEGYWFAELGFGQCDVLLWCGCDDLA